ncbi:hypothetical protein FOXG_02708 [Fusarium oxysporum f. sp. lycopersici 4287]|uniref:Uncharacterized protein n=2 Tax=Fusarium oxysporum TaxID=5507 RepID=A0A0J9UG07_FUSO4|nr:hypothetical protein FOXG_02708 [Fusarium oxysporum f. sp. lycopersici 4287]KNA98338.1 hypothetical protein FOXG_02708 [Fusarium oxysporum f. sp. lycopersici 4287]
MGPNKLIVVAFATLASLITVDAGPCRPSPTSVVTTSASQSASSTFLAETSARSLTASEASSVITESESTLTTAESTTTTTEVEGVTTTTAESEKATTTVSTETTISAETSTIASEAETSTTEAEGATTTTDEGETSTVATSIETTTAIATTESSTIISETTTATTTTAEGEPTYLINPNFDDGTTAPWIVAPNSNPFGLSSQSYQGPASGRQVFGAGPGYPYSNVFYQKIDKKLLKAGAYSLKGYVHVDQYITDDSINGCSYIAASCVAGPPGNPENMFGTSGISGNAGFELVPDDHSLQFY